MCVDLKQPEGIQIVLDLVPHVDVVIEAFTPGVMDRLGLGYDQLRQHNPRLIMCSVSIGTDPMRSVRVTRILAMR